jgi:hypothetical protein
VELEKKETTEEREGIVVNVRTHFVEKGMRVKLRITVFNVESRFTQIVFMRITTT